MRKPQEDPAVVAERQQAAAERKDQAELAKKERSFAARGTAKSLTSDVRAIYGNPLQPNVFQMRGMMR